MSQTLTHCGRNLLLAVNPEQGYISIDIFEADRTVYDVLPADILGERYHEANESGPEFWSKTVQPAKTGYRIYLHIHTDEPPSTCAHGFASTCPHNCN